MRGRPGECWFPGPDPGDGDGPGDGDDGPANERRNEESPALAVGTDLAEDTLRTNEERKEGAEAEA